MGTTIDNPSCSIIASPTTGDTDSSLVISSNGCILGTSVASIQRHGAATFPTSVQRSATVLYKCTERSLNNTHGGSSGNGDEESNSCYVYQVSGATEPSEYVPGIAPRFTNPADVDRLQESSTPMSQRPVEVSEEGTRYSGHLEVGKSFAPNYRMFSSPYPETLSEQYREQFFLHR